MDRDRWRRIQELFEAAEALAGDQRDRYLSEASGEVIEDYAEALRHCLGYGRDEPDSHGRQSALQRWVDRTRRIFEWRSDSPVSEAAT